MEQEKIINAATLEQVETSLDFVASMVATYRDSLIEHGIPKSLANEMTQLFQTSYLTVVLSAIISK